MQDTETILKAFFKTVQLKGRYAKSLPDDDPTKQTLLEEYARGKLAYYGRKAALDQKSSELPVNFKVLF